MRGYVEELAGRGHILVYEGYRGCVCVCVFCLFADVHSEGPQSPV